MLSGQLDRSVSAVHKNTDIARNIKELFAFVKTSSSGTAQDSAVAEVPYHLPDGTIIQLGNERYSCAEGLLSPQEIATVLPATAETYTEGISGALFDVVERCCYCVLLILIVIICDFIRYRLQNLVARMKLKMKYTRV